MSQEKGVTEDLSVLLEITHLSDCGQNVAGSTDDGCHPGEFSDMIERPCLLQSGNDLAECCVLVFWGSQSLGGETDSLTNGDVFHATPFDSI